MSKVSFFCIGAGKSGTTWLWSLLNQHPCIMLPKIKEMHYFNSQSFDDPSMQNSISKESISWYHKHFTLNPSVYCGDFTPCYIWDASAIDKIFEYNPDAKIIAILRDPFERTLSQYKFALNQGRIENCSFSEAVKRHEFLIRESLYAKDIKRVISVFGEKKLLLLNFNDLVKKTETVLRDVERFLCIEKHQYEFTSAIENSGGEPRSIKIVRLLTKVRIALKKYHLTKLYLFLRSFGGSRLSKFFRKSDKSKSKLETIDVKADARLNELFNRDIEELQKYVNWDLSSWYGKLHE